MGRSHRVFRSKLGMMAGLALLAVCEPGKARGQQSIYLPDPTPRPPDLQREYSNDPAQRAREEQAARLLNRMRLQEVASAANTMMHLAEEVKEQVNHHGTGAPMSAELVKVEQIEKLAKKVKDVMKAR